MKFVRPAAIGAYSEVTSIITMGASILFSILLSIGGTKHLGGGVEGWDK